MCPESSPEWDPDLPKTSLSFVKYRSDGAHVVVQNVFGHGIPIPRVRDRIRIAERLYEVTSLEYEYPADHKCAVTVFVFQLYW